MTQKLLFLMPLLLGCVPRIPAGLVPVEQAAKPVEILEMPDETNPNIYLQAVIRAGSARDPSGQEGLASLTARALAEAGAGAYDPEEIRQALYPTGNRIEVSVHRESVSLRLRCHRDHAQRCVDTFTAVLTQPRFNEEAVIRIGQEALYAVTDGLLGNEEALGQETLHGLLFEGHPYGHPSPGRGGSIAGLTADQARAFYHKHYLRSTLVVGLGGAYTAAHRETLQTGLEALPTSLPPDAAMQSPVAIHGRQLLVVATDTPVTGFHLGHLHTVSRDHKDWPALYLATMALGAHRQSSGRLFETLRTQRGLNYGNYAYMEAFEQRGWTTYPEQGALLRQPIFSLWLRPTSIENGPFALKLALDELESWVALGLDDNEFETTRQYALGHLPLEAQNTGRRIAYALEAKSGHTPNLLKTLPEALKTLTLEQVNTAIKAHIDPKNMVIVAVSGEGAQLLNRLQPGTHTPIIYDSVVPDEAQAKRDATVAKKDLGLDLEHAEVRSAKGLFR